MKICSCCRSLLGLENFRRCSASKDGKQNYCKSCQLKKSREHYLKNLADINSNRRNRYEEFSEERKEIFRVRNRRWRDSNSGYVAPCRAANPRYDADWRKQKYATDKTFKLLVVLRNRQRSEILRAKSLKSDSTLGLTGCSEAELWRYLKSKFEPGMTEENYGPVWHIDHIKPCAKFDLTDPAQQQACFHWTNLQPLFERDNKIKGAKYNG